MKRLILAAGLFLLGVLPAWATGCEPLMAALVKGVHTPWHSTMSTLVDGKPELLTETVTLTEKAYIKGKSGTWHAKFRNPAIDEAQVHRDWTNAVCTAAGTEAVGGEMADVVAQRSIGAPGAAIDTRFWISQTSGLVLKTTMSRAKSNFVILYDYADIQAPKTD